MTRAAALALVVAAACARQVTPSTPTASLAVVGRPSGVGDRALLGETLEVVGRWQGTCDDWSPHDGAYPEGPGAARPCAARDFTVVVGCDGPCSVDGRRVTPTATGPITIHIELIRPERTWRDDRRLDVVAADGFWITGCGNLAVAGGAPEIRKPIATDDVSCVVGQPPIELGVLAGGVGFAVPIELAGATVTGPLDRAAITAALGLPADARGSHRVTLGFRGLTRTVTLELR